MWWNVARLSFGPRTALLALLLAVLLAYTYIPVSRRNTADPLDQQLVALRSGSAAERSAAANQVARLGGKDASRVVPALSEALRDRDPDVRLAAVSALHVVPIDDPQAGEAVAGLIGSLRDADPRVRAQAAGILSTLKPNPKLALPALIAAALAENEMSAASSTSGVATTGPDSARTVIDRGQKDHARASAVAALGVLGGHDADVQHTLVELANDRAPEVRTLVARVLGQIGPEAAGAFSSVCKLTSDADLYIQAQAVIALGSFPADYIAACPILYRSYLSKHRPVQEGAELSLEKITKSKQFNASTAEQSQDAALRFTAAFALDPNSDSGFRTLEKALKDEDPGVRIMAATKLAKVSSSRTNLASKALQSLANDKDAEVRGQMQRSLASLSPRPPRSSSH
jgi:HEAT repeat protein